MRIDRMKTFTLVVACFGILASATYAHAANFTIGGTVSGLNTGTSVTLLDNGTDSLKVSANGTFTFATALPTGAKYKVTVGTQPTGETCTVTGGAGTVGTKNVTTVKVVCATTKTFTIGGTVSGLNTGTSVTLLDNGSDSLTVAANGTFTFKTPLPTGAAYKVTVGTQPTGETCTVTGGSGKVGTKNVTTVKVACAKPKTFTIGGTLSGLSTGASVTLLDNGADSLTLAANGTFKFKTPLPTGATYNATVGTQPTGETCTVTGGSGTVGTKSVTTIKVVCTTNKTFTIGGAVSGLNTGASVTLLDNVTDSLTVSANGNFTFAKALPTGATYSVTVGTQPTGETCTVTNGSGTVGTSNITNVKVACTTNTFTIGGAVSGLGSGLSVTLLDNGTDSLTVSSNSNFTFAKALPTGATYSVTVGTQPTGQTCTVTNGSGTVGTSNITNVAVTCTGNPTFTIGGTLSGLNSGTSVTLLDNGTDSLTRSANGTFTFAKALPSGTTYSVTVGTQPTGETCSVTNGSGTVGTSNITNVAVACSTPVGGAYWIPYSASPIPQANPPGKNGLFIIPSDKLNTSPAPTWVTTDNTRLLGIGTQITVKGGVGTYSPQVMMYADTNSSGTTSIFGLKLADTSSVPAPVQISNLVVPSTQQVCTIGSSSLTDLTTPTTLFVVIEVGTSTQCGAGTGTYEVVHYTDSSTTAPVVVSINTTEIQSVFQNGKLVGLLLYASGTKSLDLYADDTFTSPVQEITGLSGKNYVSGVLSVATLSTTGLFFQVTTSGAVNELYRIDGATLAASLIQSYGSGTIGTAPQDDTNLYYNIITLGTGNMTTETFNQVALTGGTPKLLYTTPAFVASSTTGIEGYQLIGSNDSVLAFEFYNDPFTNSTEDPTKATATLYTIPVGTTTTTPTQLANYTAGNQLPLVFLATPSGSGYPGDVLFETVQNATGTFPLYKYSFSAQSIPLNGGKAPAPIANSIYAPLAIISNTLSDSVWQATGITDTNGGYGGGTANVVNVSNLTDTPFTTTGGGNYVFPSGFIGSLFAISSNNIALGFFENAPAVIQGTGTLQEFGAAADLTQVFFLPISIQNTYVQPY